MRPAPAGDDPEAELKAAVETTLRAGYREPDDVAEWVAEAFVDHGDEDEFLPLAKRHAAAVAKALAEESRGWPGVTDCDRLDSAFAALEKGGVVARQDFSCCARCAPGELDEVMEEEESEGRKPHGYAYFHEQDTEGAVTGGKLYVGYGPRDPHDRDPAKFVAVGNEVAAALRAAGLAVEWNGSSETRILVKLKWQRRGPWAPPVAAPIPAPAAPPKPAPVVHRRALSPGEPPVGGGGIAAGAPGCILIAVGLTGALVKRAGGEPGTALFLIGVYAAAAIGARVALLQSFRRGRAAIRREDWAAADTELTSAAAFFRKHKWLDLLRWPLLWSMSRAQYRERALALLFHCRARLRREEEAVAAANELFASYADEPPAAEVRSRLKAAGYSFR